jgi:hypothetical protein
MRRFKILLTFLFLLSLAYPSHKRHKTHRHKKHKVHHVVNHHRPQVYLGANWHWNRWDHWWHDCGYHQRAVIVKNEKDNDDKHKTVLLIIEEIEKLAELKEKGLITEEEYQKKKKELLKRI